MALDKPSDVERGQRYFQRYVQNLPTSGEMVFFDRSWYNRSSVERVMKRARLAALQFFLARLEYPDRNEVVVTGPDPLIAGPSARIVDRDKPVTDGPGATAT